MSRSLSANIQAALAATPLRTCHLLTFAVGATTYRFTDGDTVVHAGNTYTPHLAVESGPRYAEKLERQTCSVSLQNLTLAAAQMLKNEGHSIQGQEATLERLFLAVRETVVLFRGRIAEVALDERAARLTLASDLDPTAAAVPRRKYANQCVWDFKDARCGYVDGVDPNDPGTGQPYVTCPKDFASCQARGRQHRFPGFLHLTRELTLAVEGQGAMTGEEDNWRYVEP